MKITNQIAGVVLGGGVAALALRLWQNLTGFEADTGLAVVGHPAAYVLPVLLVLCGAVLFVLCRQLPKRQETEHLSFTGNFGTTSVGLVTATVMGVFLMAASGALQVLMGVMGNGMQNVMTGDGMVSMVVVTGAVSPKELMLLGVTGLVSGVCLFPAAAACRVKEDSVPRTVRGELLLAPVVCLVVRLILIYRIYSVDPVVQSYYVELLAMVFTILALYRLAGFAFGSGEPRWFSWYAGMAVVLNVATLADGHNLTELMLYGGSILVVLSLLLMYRSDDAARE